jgi:hypothetical protein
MKEHEINKLNNFIMGWYIDPSICDALVEHHKTSNEKHQGLSGYNPLTNSNVNLDEKDSIDVSYKPVESDTYFPALQECSNLYNEKYPYSALSGYNIQPPILIQHYKVGGGFKLWHSERSANVIYRHLVFMTYLNDLEDGGTEFFYQGITIKAEKGLTLIWPADWTHTHKGQISNTTEKYIITGWFQLI